MTQKPTLVLMPGLDGTGKLFAPIIPVLEPHFELVVVTFPDLGSFNDYVEYAQHRLPTTPGYSLLAESLAGPVAAVIMANRPDQIGPSVLSSTFARSPLVAMTRIANLVPNGMVSIGALSDFCFDVDVDGDDFSETQPLPVNVTEQIDGTVLKHRLEVLSRIDISALLPQITVPILLMHGIHDKIVSSQDADLFESNLPRVTRANIDGPHLLLQARPRECADWIVRHVQA